MLGSYHVLNTDPAFKSYGEHAEFFGKSEKSARLLTNDNDKDPFMRKIQGNNNISGSGISSSSNINTILGYPNSQYIQSLSSSANNTTSNSINNNHNNSNYLQSGFTNSVVSSGLNSANGNIISNSGPGIGIFGNTSNSNSYCKNCKKYEENEKFLLISMNEILNLFNDITDKEKLWRQGKINFEHENIGIVTSIKYDFFIFLKSH